tara:strand:+ start:4065 stop:5225 length:1161 start_codon:yes stop_codon:yes gene_type:complete
MLKNNNFFYQIVLSFFFIFLFFTYVPDLLLFIFNEENTLADFQWSPAKLVWEGVNHYQYMMNGNIDNKIILTQNGEYHQGLYILFYPFTLLQWEYAKILWTLINIFLLIIIPLSLCKKFGLTKEKTLFAIVCILIMISSKQNLGLGQQNLFIMLFLILPFISEKKLSYILSGISYFKYNTGYALFLLIISERKYKILILSLMPAFFGWIIYCYVTKSNYIDNIFEPLKLVLYLESTITNVYIFSIISELNLIKNSSLIALVLGISINFLFIIKISKIKDQLLKLSCLCIGILIFTPHWSSDYILLIPIFIYSLKNSDNFMSKINIAVFIYLNHLYITIILYLDKISRNSQLEIPVNFYFYFSYLNILLLLFILMLNIRDFKNRQLI